MDEKYCFCCKLPLVESTDDDVEANDDHFSLFAVLRAEEKKQVEKSELLHEKKVKKKSWCDSIPSFIFLSNKPETSSDEAQNLLENKLEIHDQLLRIDDENVGFSKYEDIINHLSSLEENSIVHLRLARSGCFKEVSVTKGPEEFGFTIAEDIENLGVIVVFILLYNKSLSFQISQANPIFFTLDTRKFSHHQRLSGHPIRDTSKLGQH